MLLIRVHGGVLLGASTMRQKVRDTTRREREIEIERRRRKRCPQKPQTCIQKAFKVSVEHALYRNKDRPRERERCAEERDAQRSLKLV